MHKIENMPLQTSSIFAFPWQMRQSACFSSKILSVVKFWQETACVSKVRGWPQGWQMLGPWAAENLQMRNPRDWQGGQMLKAAKLHLKGDYEVCFKQTEEFDG